MFFDDEEYRLKRNTQRDKFLKKLSVFFYVLALIAIGAKVFLPICLEDQFCVDHHSQQKASLTSSLDWL